MIKIQKFKPNLDSLMNQFKEDYLSSMHKSDPFTIHHNVSIPDFNKYKDSHLSLAIDRAMIEETWINPSEISKMHVKKLIDGQHFINLIMKDGTTYNVEGNSIQEFFMKNAILSGDIN